MEQVPMRWPDGLRDRIYKVAGPRGLTRYVVQAITEKLERDEDGLGGVRVPRAPRPPRPPAARALAVPVVPPAPTAPVPFRHDFRPQPRNPLRCDTCGRRSASHGRRT